MIAKIVKGSSFGGCVRYVMSKRDAELIAADGILLDSVRTITDSFNDQAKMNPQLGKMVGHISLNFSVQDKDKVDDALMQKAVKEYMQDMKIVDTPYVVVRHYDKEHPHCHIIFSRIDNNGKTISDKNDHHRSVVACKAITEKYGLYLKKTDAKQNVKREQLRGPDKIKYEIYDAIKAALPHCTNWDELQKRLATAGITITYKFKGATDEKEGVIFSKDGQSFNGSKVDRQYSYSKLDAALDANAQKLIEKMTPKVNAANERQPDADSPQSAGMPQQTTEQQSHGYTWPDNDSYQHNQSVDSSLGDLIGGLFDIRPSNSDYDENEAEFLRQQRKKKKGRSL